MWHVICALWGDFLLGLVAIIEGVRVRGLSMVFVMCFWVTQNPLIWTNVPLFSSSRDKHLDKGAWKPPHPPPPPPTHTHTHTHTHALSLPLSKHWKGGMDFHVCVCVSILFYPIAGERNYTAFFHIKSLGMPNFSSFWSSDFNNCNKIRIQIFLVWSPSIIITE